MNYLDKITAHKRKEVAERKMLIPVELLERSNYFRADAVSLKKYLLREDKSGIIAEIKRRSPSKGDINPHVSVEKVSISYMQAGASALSILTDTEFFGGKNADLTTARKFNFCPILRKDFIIDEYQIIEARSIGADAILLIAECLLKDELLNLAKFAKSLGLEVLMEIHSAKELEKVNKYVDIIGVNNRDLTTFEVSLSNSLQIADKIPADFLKISESGIHSPEDIWTLRDAGFQGFLIGERFMKSGNPGLELFRFIKKIKSMKHEA